LEGRMPIKEGCCKLFFCEYDSRYGIKDGWQRIKSDGSVCKECFENPLILEHQYISKEEVKNIGHDVNPIKFEDHEKRNA
jgi:hypothetical protein